MVVDGIEGEVIRDILDREVYLAENELRAAAEVLKQQVVIRLQWVLLVL